LGNFEIAI